LIRKLKIQFFCFLCLASPLFAVESWKAACENNSPPYHFVENGRNVGMDTEVVALVMKKLNIPYVLQTSSSWLKIFSLVDKAKVDFAWQFAPTEERRKNMIFVGPLHEGLLVFLVRKDSRLEDWKKISDFNQKKMGVVAGYAYTSEFDSYKGFRKISFQNNSDLLQALVQGDVDVIVGELSTLQFLSKHSNNMRFLKFLPTTLKRVLRYVGFPKSQAEKASQFQRAFHEILKSREYKKIIEKYALL
jgi:polar amino acid transport system substrate-binding protein